MIVLAPAELEHDLSGSLAGVGRLFAEAGIALAALTGPANVLLELVGGVAMILGAPPYGWPVCSWR